MISEKIDELRMVFERLSAREKVLVLTMFGGIVIFLAVVIGIFVNISLTKLEDRVEMNRDYYEHILTLQSRFETARRKLANFQRELKGRKDTLRRDIGQLAQETGVQILQINPAQGGIDKQAGIRETSVKVELRRVELVPLLQLLEGIDQMNSYSYIRSIDMKRRFDDKNLLDVTFIVSTLLPLEDTL